jgi:hypothetical protein
VYLTNPHVGHLGIFVSASVARHEHRAILQSLDAIEALPPGLYEMKILGGQGEPLEDNPKFQVTFEPRRVEDIHFPYLHAVFERVRAVSELNEKVYDQLLSPFVRATATPWGAEWQKWAHPMRSSCYAWSERFQPWLSLASVTAEKVRTVRQEVPADNIWRSAEEEFSTMLTQALQATRIARDLAAEIAFLWLYGQPFPYLPPPPHAPMTSNCGC